MSSWEGRRFMGCEPGELEAIFPTVIMHRRLADMVPLNARLREIILNREARDPGITASNVGAWHSTPDLPEWDFPEIRALTAEFIAAGVDMTRASLPPELDGNIDVQFFGGCWANVLRDRGYNKLHNHPSAVWSGCYYVCVGERDLDPPGNGCFEFQDPRPGNIHGGKKMFNPEPGLMLMFPSWINHFVNPFKGKDERISIAFNLDVEVTPYSLPRRATLTLTGS